MGVRFLAFPPPPLKKCKLVVMAALPNSPLVSVEEYLSSSYDPDLEYVDGVLVERNKGDWLHSLFQSNILFHLRRKYPHLKVIAELRSSVTAQRYRLPDVCVLLEAPKTKYLLEAAYIVFEILSERDTQTDVMEKLEEYANKGVLHIWLIDPRLQTIWVYEDHALILSNQDPIHLDIGADHGDLYLQRDEIFAA
jgi:Uma2 family endonuclease